MLSIKTEWIRYFIVLSESKNFSEASKKLDISISALVQSVNNLENNLKLKLIKKNHNETTLTPEGINFLEKAEVFIKELSNIEFFMKKRYTLKEEIRIGWTNFWGSYILPDIIKKLSERHKNIYPKIYGFSSDEAQKLVLENKLDFAIVTGKANTIFKITESKNLNFLEGKKTNIINISSNKNPEIKINISSFNKELVNECDIEVANLSTLILILKSIECSSKIPDIIYEKLAFKNKIFNIEKTDSFITPYLIWSNNLFITETKNSFIEIFKELQ